MFAVTIDLDAYDTLPPRQLKAMLRALRFADEGGLVHASLTMLAMPGMSRSSAHRYIADLEEGEHVARQERPEGGFLWRIGRRFRYATKPIRHGYLYGRPAVGTPSPKGEPSCGGASNSLVSEESALPDGTRNAKETLGFVPAAETPVPQRGTTDSRVPARLELSSGSKEPSERELSLSEGEIPEGWEDAAAAERSLAGLGPVNLRVEWRKLVAYSEGQPITIWRWRGWVLKARCEGMAAKNLMGIKVSGDTESTMVDRALPGDESQQRHARDWVRSGFWLPNGAWGPAPDQPGCTLPAGLVAWCLRERAAAA